MPSKVMRLGSGSPGLSAKSRSWHNLVSTPGEEEENDHATDIFESVFRDNKRYGMPDSISILVNFGNDLKKILYNAEKQAHGCKVTEIWDPFAKYCRYGP